MNSAPRKLLVAFLISIKSVRLRPLTLIIPLEFQLAEYPRTHFLRSTARRSSRFHNVRFQWTTVLNNFAQKRKKDWNVSYAEDREGPQSNHTWTITAKSKPVDSFFFFYTYVLFPVNGEAKGVGVGRTKKEAKDKASEAALKNEVPKVYDAVLKDPGGGLNI